MGSNFEFAYSYTHHIFIQPTSVDAVLTHARATAPPPIMLVSNTLSHSVSQNFSCGRFEHNEDRVTPSHILKVDGEHCGYGAVVSVRVNVADGHRYRN